MSEPMVNVSRLDKAFGKNIVLTDVSLRVSPGDVVGVLGKNGAGKTTLLETILGLTPANSGQVQLFGHDSYSMPATIKQRVGFVAQQDELILQLTGRDQLRLIGSFYSNWDQAALDDVAKGWDIDLDQRIRNLSVGQRQKLSIMQSMGHHPELLVLDEPVASLDPVARRQFLRQLLAIASDPARAIIFSSHIVSDVERLANKIWIIKDHRLYWQGELDDLKDTFKRVHVRATRRIESTLRMPNVLWAEIDDGELSARLFVREWSDEATRQLLQLAPGTTELEPLALEEIFLELHR